MYPILFEYNNFQISTYGFMLMMAFIICNYLLKKYLTKINIDSSIGEDIIFYAAIGGIVGAKLYYIIEYYPSGEGYNNLLGLYSMFVGIFSFDINLFLNGLSDFGSGLVFLGGLVGGMISVTFYIYKNKLNWLEVSDWVAPYLILGHAIGRLGCFFVGCCYGKPTQLNFLFTFPNGRPPTTYESFMYNHPNIFEKMVKPFYNYGDLIKVHPTQLYEFVIYIFTFLILIKRRNKRKFHGQIMFEYLMFAGITRFLIEYFRLNPIYFSYFTSAQIISLLMICISIILLSKNSKKYKLWKM